MFKNILVSNELIEIIEGFFFSVLFCFVFLQFVQLVSFKTGQYLTLLFCLMILPSLHSCFTTESFLCSWGLMTTVAV